MSQVLSIGHYDIISFHLFSPIILRLTFHILCDTLSSCIAAHTELDLAYTKSAYITSSSQEIWCSRFGNRNWECKPCTIINMTRYKMVAHILKQQQYCKRIYSCTLNLSWTHKRFFFALTSCFRHCQFLGSTLRYTQFQKICIYSSAVGVKRGKFPVKLHFDHIFFIYLFISVTKFTLKNSSKMTWIKSISYSRI